MMKLENRSITVTANSLANMRNPGILQRKCACGQHTSAGGECAECGKKRKAEKVLGGEMLQRYAAGNRGLEQAPEIVHEVSRATGRPLDTATRQFFEPRLGQDFSGLRIYSDARAAESGYAVATKNGGPRDAGSPGGVTTPSVPSPTPLTPPSNPKHACVSKDKEQIPRNQAGITLLQGNVYDSFQMNVDWNNTGPGCDCKCGEYRQYVKGYQKVNGKKQIKTLWGDTVLEEGVFHEDGDGKSRYGHRDDPETSIDKFSNPDRATGCSYRGKDTPGLAAAPGTNLDMLLNFKGQTYDVCTNTFGKIHEWKSEFNGEIP